jgi:metallo-beta-lactamase family protein
MKIKFLGAAGTVTGSSYIVTSGGGQSILVDLGMFQGPPEIDKLNYEPYDYDCSQITSAILTHAHLDHSGRLPILLSHGFRGNIWMTPPTRDLTEISLYDSAKIADDNLRHNRKDSKEVLYDRNLAVQTVMKFETEEYRKPKQIGDFTVTFRDAGHILGAASLEIVDGRPNSEFKKIVFSGDLGNSPEPLERETELIDSADVVVMESTYGDRLHPKENPVEKVQAEINIIEKSGGTLLVPTFSLDRTQEMLHMIMHLKKEGKIKNETPVYLDSPMALKATKVYINYPKDFNQEIQNDLKIGDVFDFPGLIVVEKWDESAAIHETPGPKVIIAGSGMMTGGRIRAHAAYYLPMESTRLLIVGYQVIGTLGRRLIEGEKNVNIDGVNVNVKAEVGDTHAMSSHADQNQLMTWLKHIKGVKKVFLIHGEDEPRAILSRKITDELGIKDIVLPTMNQEIII